jgi:hypothetical protein
MLKLFAIMAILVRCLTNSYQRLSPIFASTLLALRRIRHGQQKTVKSATYSFSFQPNAYHYTGGFQKYRH